MDHPSALTRAQAAYRWGQPTTPQSVATVALHLGAEVSALAWGHGPEPEQVAELSIALDPLARRHLASARPSELAIETAIAETEDVVMPWRRRLPSGARLVSLDPGLASLAAHAGQPADGSRPWRTDEVEDLFNRWAAVALGRPATQDNLPTGGLPAARLLVLREWLHHLGFDAITVATTPP